MHNVFPHTYDSRAYAFEAEGGDDIERGGGLNWERYEQREVERKRKSMEKGDRNGSFSSVSEKQEKKKKQRNKDDFNLRSHNKNI